MTAPLTIIAQFRAKPGQETRAREVLQALLAPTRAEAGCINYDLHQSLNDPAAFVFYENWESAAHLEAHARSAHIRVLHAVEPEVFTAPPEISRWAAVRCNSF